MSKEGTEENGPNFALADPFSNFKNFLYVAWKHLGLPDPTAVQYDIADWMQNGPRRQITEAFRGVGKSWIAAAFVCWKLYLNPQLKFLVVSASKGRADAFSIFVKRLIDEMSILRHLRSRDEQRSSTVAFDVGPATNDQSPSVKSVGITGQLTGSRADYIIPDDVESLNNSATSEQRQKLGERIKEFDAVLKPGGSILYLGTPQTEFSIYNELALRGYETRVWPAEVPSGQQRNNYGTTLAPLVAAMVDQGAAIGSTIEPLRFTDLDLAERKASFGRSGYALQFMLDTTLTDAEKYPLKLADLIVMPLTNEAPSKVIWCSLSDKIASHLPNVGLKGDHLYHPMEVSTPYGPYTGKVMTIDPSGRGKDETAYAVVGIRNALLYLGASGGFQGGYTPETLQALARLAKAQGVKEIIIEDNFGDGMFGELFKPWLVKTGYPCTVTQVHSVGQKEKRIIDILEPVMNQHRLVIDEQVIREDTGGVDEDGSLKRNPIKSLLYQLTRITKDRGALRHDDRLEALAMAVGYWTEQMARDVDSAMEDTKQALLDDDLADFMDHCIGGLREQNWMGQS